jgi:hypothetical protein
MAIIFKFPDIKQIGTMSDMENALYDALAEQVDTQIAADVIKNMRPCLSQLKYTSKRVQCSSSVLGIITDMHDNTALLIHELARAQLFICRTGLNYPEE